MKKKAFKFTFDDLEPEAKAFIECKVRVLGSTDAVKQSYRMNDLVSTYALAYATAHFGSAGVPQIWSKGRRRRLI